MSFALGQRARGVRFGGTAPSGAHSTIVTMGGTWVWPNPAEFQFMVFEDSSWMMVGQSLAIDDGVHSGVLLILAISDEEPPPVVECAWTVAGPPGGTVMLDGAAVTLLTT